MTLNSTNQSHLQSQSQSQSRSEPQPQPHPQPQYQSQMPSQSQSPSHTHCHAIQLRPAFTSPVSVVVTLPCTAGSTAAGIDARRRAAPLHLHHHRHSRHPLHHHPNLHPGPQPLNSPPMCMISSSGGSPEKSSNNDGNNPFRFLYHHHQQQQPPHKQQQKQSNSVPPDIVTGINRFNEPVAVPQPLLPRVAPPMATAVDDGSSRNKPLQTHPQGSRGTFWNGVRRVVKVSCISASMLFAPCTLQSVFNLSSSPSPPSPSTPPVSACISQTTHPQKQQQQQTQNNSPLLVRLDHPSAARTLQRHALTPRDSDTSNDKNNSSENKMTNAAMIMHELSCRTGAAANAATTSATVSSASTGQASDVEVAAMTLGAVTLGGVIMRTLLTVSRDQKAERDRLAKECARLQDEEENRALRLERTRLETAGLSSRPDPDADQNELMSALRQRVQNMEESDDEDDEDVNDGSVSGKQNDDRKKNKKKKNEDMRQSPIPDRGMGSAVLERPDGDANDENNGQDDSEQDNDENPPGGETLAKPDQAEMLKRMWNLSPPDKE